MNLRICNTRSFTSLDYIWNTELPLIMQGWWPNQFLTTKVNLPFGNSLHVTLESHSTDNPKKQPSTMLQTIHLILNVFTYVHNLNLWNVDLSIFHKVDRFFGPTTAWIVQNSVDNADACMPRMRDCPPLLIDSTTGHYNSTFMHSTSLWLAFLATEQQRSALECGL